MIYKPLYRRGNNPRRLLAGIIGPGHYGTAIISQSIHSPLLHIPIAADRNPERATAAFRTAGVPENNIRICRSVTAAQAAIEAGAYAIVEDAMILMDLPLDVIVESTGIAEAGAVHALSAIEHGKHVAMVNKETDSAVGPILQRLASRQGVTYTQVDGDHPGLLIGLIEWARLLGLEIVAAGKSRDVELVLDRRSRTVTCEADGITVFETQKTELSNEELELFDYLGSDSIPDRVRARRRILEAMPRAEGYDHCEVLIAANACGLVPDIPSLHNPILRMADIPRVLCPTDEGGLLSVRGSVDVIDCFRDDFEGGLGGAVWVVVSCDNDYSRMIMTTKGLVSNRSGKSALIYRPYHLCGVETSTSILCAGIQNVSTGSDTDTYMQRFDIVRTPRKRLASGYVFGGDHDQNLDTLIVPAQPMHPNAPAPAHLLHTHKLTQDVDPGTVITYGMVAKPQKSVLWDLRVRQNEFIDAAPEMAVATQR